MSEATFRQHLNQLENILGQLQGDLETGSINQANDWYDEIVETVLDAFDRMEGNLNPRMGYDAESLEDEDVVQPADLEALEQEEEDAALEETSDGTDETEGQEIEDSEIESKDRILTININLGS